MLLVNQQSMKDSEKKGLSKAIPALSSSAVSLRIVEFTKEGREE